MLTFGDALLIACGVAAGKIIARIVGRELERYEQRITVKADIVYKVKADNPDVPFSIAVNATDSEGNPVTVNPGDIETDVTSSNEDLVSVVMDDDGNNLTGIVHFGRPSGDGEIASIEATIKHKGEVVDIVGAQFVVTAGDPSDFGGSTITFGDLTEEPPTDGGEPIG